MRINRVVQAGLLTVAVAFTAASLLSSGVAYALDDCSASKIHWGRQNCHGYFTNTVSQGGDVVIRAGIKVENVTQYISKMSSYLNAGSGQEKVGAAFHISVMMGQDPLQYNGSIQNGINWAKSNFSRWQTVVQWYSDHNLIDWHYAFSSALPYEDSGYGITTGDNFFITNSADTADSIRFRLPVGVSGTPFMIDRSCANLQGYGSPLVIPPTTNPPTPPPGTPPPGTPPPGTPPPGTPPPKTPPPGTPPPGTPPPGTPPPGTPPPGTPPPAGQPPYGDINLPEE